MKPLYTFGETPEQEAQYLHTIEVSAELMHFIAQLREQYTTLQGVPVSRRSQPEHVRNWVRAEMLLLQIELYLPIYSTTVFTSLKGVQDSTRHEVIFGILQHVYEETMHINV